MPRSLASRFFIASIIILPILLVVFALSLDAAFRSSLLSGEEERLKTQAYFLIGIADFIDNELFLPPESFRDERFTQVNSGLYGIIYDDSGQELWRSQSAQLLELTPIDARIVPGQTGFQQITQGNRPLFVFYYDVVWEFVDSNSERGLRFLILHDQSEALAEQTAYRKQLWESLGLIGLLILASQMAILRWGLRPLKKLAKDLVSVETGTAQALEGDYPTEIQAVTNNLNQVLASERQQRQRYRNTLDDLAHSLKTPLSVIKGSLQQHPSETVAEQVERMNQIISHQLQRAVVAGPGVPGKAVAIKPVVERLTKSLTKVYQEKKMAASIAMSDAIRFNGDERDLMEVLGNLIENAYKYGKHAVKVSGEQTAQAITIVIEDDGNGVDPEARQTILQRGARADTATSGQGIGLAVTVDILSSYKGSLVIAESTLGGARFEISLPLIPK